MQKSKNLEYSLDEYVPDKPFYLDVAGETEIFTACFHERIPVMLKGPTGCGKTRFVHYMAYALSQSTRKNIPLITVPCHEDLTADDLKGRHLITGEYLEGAALIAARKGGILYLDEVVEARQDTTVVIHPLSDYRRTLIVEKLGKVIEVPPEFMLAISYNPGYQSKIKDLKQSTKQRFVAINFDYPPKELEMEIIKKESGYEDQTTADFLTEIGKYLRNLKGKGLEEGASTRLLIDAAKLIKQRIPPRKACEAAILNPITDDKSVFTDKDVVHGIEDIFSNFFP